MRDKKLPTRRDRREAIGYIEDLFATGNEGDHSHEVIAERLIDNAQEIRVLRAGDRLVLYFDLTEDEGQLPPAGDEEKVSNGPQMTEAVEGTFTKGEASGTTVGEVLDDPNDDRIGYANATDPPTRPLLGAFKKRKDAEGNDLDSDETLAEFRNDPPAGVGG